MDTQSTITARTGLQRDGTPVTAKPLSSWPDATKKALCPSIWRGVGTLTGELAHGNEVELIGMPTVEKVAEFGDKRWAWLHIAAGVRIKVYEGSSRAEVVGLQFDGGKYRPAVVANRAVLVRGKLRAIESGFTLGIPWIVRACDMTSAEAAAVAAVQAQFDGAYGAALASVQDDVEEQDDDQLDD